MEWGGNYPANPSIMPTSCGKVYKIRAHIHHKEHNLLKQF